jgi:hypothetical protein
MLLQPAKAHLITVPFTAFVPAVQYTLVASIAMLRMVPSPEKRVVGALLQPAIAHFMTELLFAQQTFVASTAIEVAAMPAGTIVVGRLLQPPKAHLMIERLLPSFLQ